MTIRWDLVELFAVLIFVAFAHPAHAECLHSAQEVRDQHPGAWPSWHGPRSAKCWFGDYTRHSRVRIAARPHDRKRAAIPLPRRRPDIEMEIEIAAALQAPKLPPTEAKSLAIMLDEIIAADRPTIRAWALNGMMRVDMLNVAQKTGQ